MTSPPTHNVPEAVRKPRRLGLIIPWAIALALALGWSAVWLWMFSQTSQRLDAEAARLRAAGWQVAWAGRRIEGYPFRLDVDFTGLVLKDPSGWAVSLPRIDSEAYVFAPTHWVFAAPGGLTLTRRDGGAVTITARVLRATVSDWDQRPPNLALEGDDLAFTSAPGAKPLWLTGARVLQVEMRPGPEDQGALYVGVQDGVADPGAWLGRVAAGKPVKLVAETTFDHASQITGHGWGAALTRWAQAGGALDIQQLTLDAGDASLASRQGSLSVSDDGDLTGRMTVQSPQALRFFKPGPKPASANAKPGMTINFHLGHISVVSGPGAAPTSWTPARTITLNLGKKVRVTGLDIPESIIDRPLELSFHDGAAWLGPIKLGPSPRVF